MQALVTGGAGFVGGHLATHLLRAGFGVWSLDRRPGGPPGTRQIEGDLANPHLVRDAVAQAQPDVVYHLAARTPANAPEGTIADWLGGDPVVTHHLLEAVRSEAPGARVLVVSSSAVYGNTPMQPIGETCPFRPAGLYGVSKASVELVADRFHTTEGLFVVRARPFNLVGPGEPAAMLTSTLAAQVARIRSGEAEPVLRLRHRGSARDYLDVRDAVRAYCLLLDHGAPGEAYNVCSGRATPIGLVAQCLLDIARLTARVEETAPVMSPGDVLTQAGNPAKLVEVTGWSPTLDLEHSLADLLESLRLAKPGSPEDSGQPRGPGN